jgi:carbon storage regulator
VVLVEIRGDKVRLGIEAPKDVPVHRQEVFDALHRVAGGEEPGTTSQEEPSHGPDETTDRAAAGD